MGDRWVMRIRWTPAARCWGRATVTDRMSVADIGAAERRQTAAYAVFWLVVAVVMLLAVR